MILSKRFMCFGIPGMFQPDRLILRILHQSFEEERIRGRGPVHLITRCDNYASAIRQNGHYNQNCLVRTDQKYIGTIERLI